MKQYVGRAVVVAGRGRSAHVGDHGHRAKPALAGIEHEQRVLGQHVDVDLVSPAGNQHHQQVNGGQRPSSTITVDTQDRALGLVTE